MAHGVEALEKVQKRATKILPALRHLTYPDRLKVCKLTTLRYRQIRGDMIETYKIISGKYNSEITPTLAMSDTRITRGNDLRLHKSRFKYDMRKFYYANRVVDHWNCLPNWVVTANNIKLAATLRGSRPGVQSASPKSPKIQVFRGHPAPRGRTAPIF